MPTNPIFPKGVKPTQNFTGDAYINFLVPDTDSVYDCQVYDVVFEPGCRNYWHKHAGGQILLCTDGVGYYQERGQSARRLQKGDVVTITPEVEHWHGASPDSEFTHIGISPNTQKGATMWLGAVTDEEYRRAVKGAE